MKTPDKKIKSLSTQVFHGLSWSYISAILSAILHLVSLSLLAHLLAPSEFGLLGMALIFVSFAERIGQLGVGPALVQRQDITERQTRIAASTGILSGLLIYAAFYCFSPLAAAFFEEPKLVLILRVLAIVFILEGIGMVSDSRMQRKLRFKGLLLVDNLSYLLGGCIAAALLAYYGFGVWALVFGLIINRLIKVLMLISFEPQGFCLFFSFREVASLLNYGAGFSLGRLLNFSALYGDNFVVGKVLGSDALGLYSRAYQLMTLPVTYFAQIIDRVLFPALSKKQDNLEQMRRAFFFSVDAVCLVSLPLGVFMYLAAKEIVLVVMGDQWDAMVPILGTLSLGMVFRTGYKTGDTLSRSLGAVYQHASRQVIYTVAVIAGSIIGSTVAGLQGVAVAVFLAVALNFMLMSQLSLKLLKSSWKNLFLSHLPGIWIAAWIGVSLFPAEFFITTFDLNKYCALCFVTIIAGLASLLAVVSARGRFRSSSLNWLARQSQIGKRGRIGAWIENTFLIIEPKEL